MEVPNEFQRIQTQLAAISEVIDPIKRNNLFQQETNNEKLFILRFFSFEFSSF